MVHLGLEGRLVVLGYSFGPYWNEEVGGCDNLTIWRLQNGKLTTFYHQGEPNKFDYERAIRSLEKRKVSVLYTPSPNLFYGMDTFLGLDRESQGDNFDDKGDITDWTKYEPICPGEYLWDILENAGIRLEVFDSL